MDVNGSCSSWEWDAIGIISSQQSWYDLLLLALCRTISRVCLACGQPWLLRILFHVATSERHRPSNIEQHAKDHDNPKQVSSLGGRGSLGHEDGLAATGTGFMGNLPDTAGFFSTKCGVCPTSMAIPFALPRFVCLFGDVACHAQ